MKSTAYLEKLVELLHLVRLSAQLIDGLHRVDDDADLVCAAGFARVQQFRQFVETAQPRKQDVSPHSFCCLADRFQNRHATHMRTSAQAHRCETEERRRSPCTSLLVIDRVRDDLEGQTSGCLMELLLLCLSRRTVRAHEVGTRCRPVSQALPPRPLPAGLHDGRLLRLRHVLISRLTAQSRYSTRVMKARATDRVASTIRVTDDTVCYKCMPKA